MINIIARALLMSTPLLIGATAEVIAERAGVMIIAVEGIFSSEPGAALSVSTQQEAI